MILNIPIVYWKRKFGKPLLSIFQVVPLSSLYQVKWDIIKSSEHVSTTSTLKDLDPKHVKDKGANEHTYMTLWEDDMKGQVLIRLGLSQTWQFVYIWLLLGFYHEHAVLWIPSLFG